MAAEPVEVPRSARAITWARRRRALSRTWKTYRASKMGMGGLAILVLFVGAALFAPVLADRDGLSAVHATGLPFQPPSAEFWFGTDHLGRSVMTMIIWGSRVSLAIGLLATMISVVLGAVVGILAGFFAGWRDTALMRFTDWFLVMPFLPLVIVLATLIGGGVGAGGIWLTAFVIGITSWPGTARLVRSQTLTVKERPYIERARALGRATGT